MTGGTDGFETEQQDEKIVDKEGITLAMVYEELKQLKRLVAGATMERMLRKLDTVNVMASKGERKIEDEDDEPEATTAADAASTGRWANSKIFRWFEDKLSDSLKSKGSIFSSIRRC